MSTATRIAALVAVATFGTGLAACSADVNSSTPDGGSGPSLNIDVSVPDISLPDIGGGNNSGDSGNSGNSGNSGDSGNSGGNSGDNSGGNSGGGGATSGSTGTGGSAASSSLGPLGWAVLVIGLIAVVALFMASSNSGGRDEAEEDRRRSNSRKLNGIIQNARWAESQASTALTIENARQLQSAWTQARSYLPDVETAAAGLATDTDDSELASAISLTGQNVASLRGAMDQYVQVRAHHDIDDAASTGAEQTVRQAMSSVDHSVQRVSDLSVAQQR